MREKTVDDLSVGIKHHIIQKFKPFMYLLNYIVKNLNNKLDYKVELINKWFTVFS